MTVVELSGNPGGGYLRAAAGLRPGRSRGRTLPDRELIRRRVPVDRSHLAAYDRVCGFRLTDALPATYPHVLAFPLAMHLMSAADFPFPVVGLVHITNRITVHRPIDAAEQMDLSVRAADLRPHARGQQFDLIATATIDGEEVWRGVSTYLRKQRNPPTQPDSPAQPDQPTQPDLPTQPSLTTPPALTGKVDLSARLNPRAEGNQEGSATAPWRIPARTGRDYAAVSGDRNPIHTSRLGARLFGFRRPIAHGMWSMARCLAALEGRLPAQYTVDVQFKAPILLPSTVSFQAAWLQAASLKGASFLAAGVGGGWEFGVRGRRSHLAGQVTHP